MKFRGIIAGAVILVLSGAAAVAQVNPGIGSTQEFGGVTINPIVPSNNPGLVIGQTTPNTGSVAGPILLNSITVTDQAQTVTGSGIDAFGQITNQTDVFRLNYTVAGGAANHFGGNFAANITATNGGTVPLLSSCYINVGTITGDCWGNIAVGNVGPSGNLNQSLIGYEAEMLVADTGVLKDRIGFSANSQGPTVATRYDEAYSISTLNLGVTHYLTGAPWSNGLHLNNGLYGGSFPIASTGNVILSDTGTVANVISAHTLTVTGNVIDTPFVQITGPGSATFGAGSSATSNVVKATCATCGFAELTVSANGTSAADSLLINDSSGNNAFVTGVFEAGSTITRFGQTTGNWGQLSVGGTTNAGLMMGTLTSEPLILGTNNTTRVTLGAAGGVFLVTPETITSASAGALTVGPNGATNPTFVVDDSASSAANGVYVFSTAAGSAANITTVSSATNEGLKINAKGSGVVTLGNVSSGGVVLAAPAVVTGASAAAFQVGPNGSTNPTLYVDTSAGSAATGIDIQAGAAGNGLAITVISSGMNEALGINAKGSGTIGIGTVSTGAITLARATTLSGALTYGGVAFNNSSTGASGGSLVGSASPTIATPVLNGLPTGTGVATANTASTLVARDGSGNFSAGTITGALTGHASSDCALTGCTMSGAIAMGTNAITGLTTLAASGAMTFQSNGSTLAGTVTTGQNWGIGTETNAQNKLVVSANTATGIAGTSFASQIRAIAVDSSSAAVEANSFGNASRFIGTSAGGTAASKTAIGSADFALLNFSAFGWDGSSYYAASAWIAWSSQAFTAGAHGGSYLTAYTTPNNTQTAAEAMRIQASGGLSVGSSTDTGIGTINANVGFYAGGTKGVTCSGALTVVSSITIKDGIITAATGTGGTCS